MSTGRHIIKHNTEKFKFPFKMMKRSLNQPMPERIFIIFITFFFSFIYYSAIGKNHNYYD